MRNLLNILYIFSCNFPRPTYSFLDFTPEGMGAFVYTCYPAPIHPLRLRFSTDHPRFVRDFQLDENTHPTSTLVKTFFYVQSSGVG